MKFLNIITPIKRLTFLFFFILAVFFVMAGSVRAEETGRTVRVGWYDSPFNTTDQFGRRSGYAYEYQRKIAAYTGWKYVYVKGSWLELMQLLKKGEIDLMSDVSFSRERTKDILYASLPMGTEAYYIFTVPDNTEISSDDYKTLNGKRIGVTKSSVQKDLYLGWARTHDISAELIEMTGSEEDSLQMMRDGKIDAFITLDVYGDPETTMPVCKIGSSDFYFAVSKKHPDLLTELDAALNRIQDENKYYKQELSEKYLRSSGANLYLSAKEKKWLDGHRTIRVGYQDNYLAFCASDPKTGELTGALKDYLAYASTGLENAQLNFEAVAFPTAAAALEALKKGEVDCMFPANLTDFDGENMGVVMTPALMRTEMDAVVRASEQKEFVHKKDVTVAVNKGNTNYEMFLVDNYPGWKTAHFPDTPTGLNAVAEGKADCVIISNYRFNNISRQCEKLHLTTVYTGVDMDYYFAVREGDTELYSILSKVTGMVPDSAINAALTYYSTEDARTSLVDLVIDNLLIVMTVISLILLVIVVLLLRSIRMERKVSEEEHLLENLNKRVFVDSLTSVRNKGAFTGYIQEMQKQLELDEHLEYAIGIFDCDYLKNINDEFGHDKGDIYLKTASQMICRVFQHSPVFRIGGDEFAVVLQNEDFRNREELMEKFITLGREICSSAENKWEEVHVAMGIAVYDPKMDLSVNDTIRRADKIMYENKRMAKSAAGK